MFNIFYYDENNIRQEIISKVHTVAYHEQLGAAANNFSVKCNFLSYSMKRKLVEVLKDGLLILSGYVLNDPVSDEGNGQYSTELICADFTWILQNRIIAKIYENISMSAIIHDVIAYIGDGFTTDLVLDNPDIVTQLPVKYKPASEVFEDLTELSYDWYWYVDQIKRVHYFKSYETIGRDIGGADIIDGTLNIDNASETACTRIWVIGAKQAAANHITDYIQLDGKQRYYPVNYEPNYVSVTLNGIDKNIKLEQNDDGAQDFLYNKAAKMLIVPQNIDTVPTGEVAFRYRPTKQVIDYFDAAGKSNLLIERAIVNKDIVEKADARKFGRAEISKRSIDKRILSFETFSTFKIGERRAINLVDGELTLKGNFVVTQVSSTMTTTQSRSSVTLLELL